MVAVCFNILSRNAPELFKDKARSPSILFCAHLNNNFTNLVNFEQINFYKCLKYLLTLLYYYPSTVLSLQILLC